MWTRVASPVRELHYLISLARPWLSQQGEHAHAYV